MTRYPLHHLSGVAAVLAFAALGCTDAPTAQSATLTSLRLAALTPATVRTVLLEVTGPGIAQPILANFPVAADSVARGSLEIPSGASRRFLLSAFDSSGVRTHAADTTFQVSAGAPIALQLVLQPIGTDVGVTVSIGNATLTVWGGANSIAVGGSTTLSAAALRADGTPVPADSLFWSVVNPSVANVVSGQVTGVTPGETAVLVRFRQLYAGRAITVTP